jgi:hypothetical protein
MGKSRARHRRRGGSAIADAVSTPLLGVLLVVLAAAVLTLLIVLL